MFKSLEDSNIGKIAFEKFGIVPENFHVYEAGWLGKHPKDWSVLEVKGAEFREAKRGKNKGKICVLIKGTERVTYVTAKELNERK